MAGTNRVNVDLDILDYYDGKIKDYVDDKVRTGGLTIDDTLSDTSTNPVQNKIVKQAIDNKADKTVATTTDDGLMSASDKGKLDSADDTYALKSKYGDTTIDVGRKADTTVGFRSTAEGNKTTASGLCSHAEGNQTIASETGSHAEGEQTTASGSCSHTEGLGTIASNQCTHAEGIHTTASGANSHAEGQLTTASGANSHAGGWCTEALHDNEVSYGKYNKSNNDTLFSVGDGTSESARHNAFEITTTGGKLHDKDIATTNLIPNLSPYAKTADVPNIKVNEAVNADTLNGMSAETIRSMSKNVDSGTSVSSQLADGTYCGAWSDVPSGLTDAQGILIVSNYNTNGSPSPWSHRTFYSPHYNMIWHGFTANNIWYGWREISTTPIKSEILSTSTDENGNAMIYTESENKKIISINCFAKQAGHFNYNNNQYGHFYENDGTPYVGAVSFCAYYIEG